jgi:hypothetical protein
VTLHGSTPRRCTRPDWRPTSPWSPTSPTTAHAPCADGPRSGSVTTTEVGSCASTRAPQRRRLKAPASSADAASVHSTARRGEQTTAPPGEPVTGHGVHPAAHVAAPVGQSSATPRRRHGPGVCASHLGVEVHWPRRRDRGPGVPATACLPLRRSSTVGRDSVSSSRPGDMPARAVSRPRSGRRRPGSPLVRGRQRAGLGAGSVHTPRPRSAGVRCPARGPLHAVLLRQWAGGGARQLIVAMVLAGSSAEACCAASAEACCAASAAATASVGMVGAGGVHARRGWTTSA